MRLIIDAGCNLLEGYNKLKIFESITDEDRKVFIEANPECWSYLDEYTAGIPNSRLYKNALATEIKNVELVTRSEHSANTAATILGKDFLDQSLMRWNMRAEGYTTYSVETTTLFKVIVENTDASIDNIILKLDVEGMEYEILNHLLNSDCPIKKIYCEFHVHCLDDERSKQALLSLAASKGVSMLPWD